MVGPLSVSGIDAGISAVERLAAASGKPGAAPADGGPDFAALLREQLGELVSLQDDAARLTQQLAAGQISDVNQVVLAVQKADLALNFAMQLRSKVLEAYQEISRMQV